MYRLYVMQHQWAAFAFFSGFATVAAMALTYMMIWLHRVERPPEEAQAPGPAPMPQSLWRWYFSFMPWILNMTFLFSFLFALLYMVALAIAPPNW